MIQYGTDWHYIIHIKQSFSTPAIEIEVIFSTSKEGPYPHVRPLMAVSAILEFISLQIHYINQLPCSASPSPKLSSAIFPMRIPRGYSCFLLLLLFIATVCHGAEVFGVGECDGCEEHNFKTSQAFTGLKVTIDCKPENGEFKTRGSAELDGEGNFKVSLPEDIVKDGKLKEKCYAQLHNAAATPCPAHDGLDAAEIVLKSSNAGKHSFGLKGKLKFSPVTCASAFFWPHFKYPPMPKLKHPKLPLPPFKGFGHPIPKFPPFHKKPFPPIFKKPLPPPVPIYEKPLPPPVPVYKKPQPPPVPVYKKPLPPPVPVYKKPNPPPVPVYKKPLPPPVPVYKKPHPPPTPVYKKPCPPPVPVYKKPNPPPVPVYKKPHPPPVPVYKKPNPPPVPVYKKPQPPPVPVYKKPLPPPVPVYKKPLPPPVPVYKKPLPPPVPIYKKPLPPPVPIYKPHPPLLPKIPPFPKKPCPPLPKLPPFPKFPPKVFHHPKFGKFPPLPPFAP